MRISQINLPSSYVPIEANYTNLKVSNKDLVQSLFVDIEVW